ncbi:M66 family metalloprotease [Microbacterium hominis]|uniref:Peptidase M66 n=1 Tax=Microbacterium hominis TaxID=162426 RepID=A0A7D4PVA9_9MICO|nr:M66 family metalloprotease [Microbacterium hominis]QKJ20373.1 hypothetical protein HQM25_14055 [Microbacterium hominis]
MGDLDFRVPFDAEISESLVFRLGLTIGGIEVNQSVQFYDSEKHLTDPADRQGDNAQRLVAHKPAFVRVYVGSLFGASSVTGTLEVQRRMFGWLYKPVTTRSPHGSSMTSVPSSFSTTYAGIRGDLGETLNFVIPAAYMYGNLRLIARVKTANRTAERTINVSVTLRQTLRLAGVMISYNGPASMAPNAPNLQLAAPTLADLQNMSGTSLSLFPVESTAQFRVAGNLVQTNHLQDSSFPPSGCGTQWNALHARVANVRTADGNQPGWIYYGLLPSGTPMGPVGGCGGGGVAVGPINQPWTLAHEAGHAAGLPHAPSGGAPNPDPNFPPYEPYDPAGVAQGRTGEYGIDVSAAAVKSPATFRDVMGYATPKWISPYNYGRLTDNAQFSPRTVGIDEPWWHDLVWEELPRIPKIPIPDPPPFDFDLELPVFPPLDKKRVISVIVHVDGGTIGERVQVARVAAHPQLPAAGATPFTVRLLDEGGEVIATGEVVRLTTSAGGCGGCGDKPGGRPPASYVAQAFLPDVAPGAALEIVARGETVWRREASGEEPWVRVAEPEEFREGISVWWESSPAEEYWIRYSRDGEEWSSVATEVTEQKVSLPTGTLPVGEGYLQVVAHDGFASAESEPVRVWVREREPAITIQHPKDGYTYQAGVEVRLWASVLDASAEDIEGAEWTIDGEPVARGLDEWVALSEGKHEIAVAVGKGRSEIVVQAVGREDQRRRAES